MFSLVLYTLCPLYFSMSQKRDEQEEAINRTEKHIVTVSKV